MTVLDDSIYKNLLEAAPDGILIADSDGTILVVNEQVETLFGYKRNELVGQSVELLVPEQLRGLHTKQRQGYQRRPATRPMGVGLDLVGRCKDGREVPLAISLSPVHLSTGLFTIAVIRDITERIRLAAEREALRVAFETEQERQRIGMDLHDGIMQDVYAVSLGLEMALSDLRGEPELSEQALDKAIEDLHNVVRDIRNYIFDLRPRRFSGELAQALIDLGREFQDNTSIRTEVSTPSEPTPVREDVAVAIYHIAHEALSNVRKHARADRVDVLLRLRDGGIEVKVRDNGLGFDMSAEPGESHRGLRNMDARARAAGGELEVSSAPGQGTQIKASFRH